MAALEFFGQPFCQRLAMTLLHFVWQGFLIIGLAAWLVKVLNVRRPQVRYAFDLATLMIAACCPLVTFAVIETPPLSEAVSITAARRAGSRLPPSYALPLRSRNEPARSALPSGGSLTDSVRWGVFRRPATTAGPYVVLVWLAGVLLLSTRLLFGVAALSRLRRSRQPIPRQLAEILQRLNDRFGFRATVPVFVSAEVHEALAVGLWRPMVLLPFGWVTNLPPAVIEAVIAHELAHVRRWDLWVNLFQRVVETMLFYHPAIWWLSGRVRAEREMCCDRLAVSVTGERLLYAEALELLARKKFDKPQPLLATGMGDRKMALLNRVRHVLGNENHGPRVGGWWSAGLIAVAIPAVMWLAAAAFTPAVAADDGDRERPRVDRESRERADRGPERRERDRSDAGRPRRPDREHVGPRRPPLERPDIDGPRPPLHRRPLPERGERLGRFGGPHDLRPLDRPLGPPLHAEPEEELMRRHIMQTRQKEQEEMMRHIMQARQKEQAEMMRLIVQLRQEVERLSREVHELHERRGPEAGHRRPEHADPHWPRGDFHRDPPWRKQGPDYDPHVRGPHHRDIHGDERGERERGEHHIRHHHGDDGDRDRARRHDRADDKKAEGDRRGRDDEGESKEQRPDKDDQRERKDSDS